MLLEPMTSPPFFFLVFFPFEAPASLLREEEDGKASMAEADRGDIRGRDLLDPGVSRDASLPLCDESTIKKTYCVSDTVSRHSTSETAFNVPSPKLPAKALLFFLIMPINFPLLLRSLSWMFGDEVWFESVEPERPAAFTLLLDLLPRRMCDTDGR